MVRARANQRPDGEQVQAGGAGERAGQRLGALDLEIVPDRAGQGADGLLLDQVVDLILHPGPLALERSAGRQVGLAAAQLDLVGDDAVDDGHRAHADQHGRPAGQEEEQRQPAPQ
jgi:hypothetical protein